MFSWSSWSVPERKVDLVELENQPKIEFATGTPNRKLSNKIKVCNLCTLFSCELTRPCCAKHKSCGDGNKNMVDGLLRMSFWYHRNIKCYTHKHTRALAISEPEAETGRAMSVRRVTSLCYIRLWFAETQKQPRAKFLLVGVLWFFCAGEFWLFTLNNFNQKDFYKFYL